MHCDIAASRIYKPLAITEHRVLCFFQEVIRELVSEGVTARYVHTGEARTATIRSMS